MGWFILSISHWGMVPLYCEAYQSYWDHVWWMNADVRGASPL